MKRKHSKSSAHCVHVVCQASGCVLHCSVSANRQNPSFSIFIGEKSDDLRGQFTVKEEAGVQIEVVCLRPELSTDDASLTHCFEDVLPSLG